MRQFVFVLLFCAFFAGCTNKNVEDVPQASADSTPEQEAPNPVSKQDQEEEIRKLIEQLVFSDDDATNQLSNLFLLVLFDDWAKIKAAEELLMDLRWGGYYLRRGR